VARHQQIEAPGGGRRREGPGQRGAPEPRFQESQSAGLFRDDYSGSQHEHTQQISRKRHDQIKKGQRVEVLCLPDDPQTALLTGKDADNSHFKRRLATAIFCAVLLVLVAGVTLLSRL
jgi:hypothetical protein